MCMSFLLAIYLLSHLFNILEKRWSRHADSLLWIQTKIIVTKESCLSNSAEVLSSH